MFLTYVAYGLSGLLGLGIIFVGARFLLVPHAAAAAYGVAVRRDGGGTDAFLAAKGVRDIASGLVVFVLLAAAPHVLGWWMLAMAIIPIGDALIVLRHGSSKAIAYGVHGATAVVMLAVAGLLFV